MTYFEIIQKALKVYSVHQQRFVLIEEIGELLSAIGKQPRGRATNEDVLEELADVVIMCEQIAVSISYDGYKKKKREKIARLEAKLEKIDINYD